MTVSARQETQTPSGKPWRQSADRERIRAYVQEHPTATVRQIARHCGINSTSHVHRMLKQVRAELCVCPTCGGKGSIRTSAPDDGPGRAPRSEAEFPLGKGADT